MMFYKDRETGEITDEEGRLCVLARHEMRDCVLRFVPEQRLLEVYYLDADGGVSDRAWYEQVQVTDCAWGSQRGRDSRP